MPNTPQDHPERRSLTSQVDRLRGSISEQTIKNTIDRYTAICKMYNDQPDQLKKDIKAEIFKCFPENKHKVIREFFMEHPVCWTDIQRKIHAFRDRDKATKRWFIPDDKLGGIYESFLIRGRKDIGPKIRNLLPRAISDNQELLDFAGAQPSLLDEGGYIFSKITPEKRKKLIKSLIKTGMMRNIEGCTYENINEHIGKIFPKLLRYIAEIFGKPIHLGYCKTLDELTRELEKQFASGHGNERENAFRVIQSFHAWSNIEEIEKIHILAQEKIENIPKKFKEMGINIDGEIEYSDHNEATIYRANIIFQGKKYRCVWRVKTVKSILQKMWETEEYTNKDAIRDMIGVHFIWPDDTPLDDKKKLIIKGGMLMQDFGYILKDKGGVGKDIYDIENNLKSVGKAPIHVSSKLDGTSNPEINNTSISGFMSLGGASLGTEFQYSDEKGANWKKNDDQKYKPKGMLSILMRGPKFATPKDCYALINERIRAGTLQELGFSSINMMILWYIEKEKFLIPYISENANELLITNKCPGVEDTFKEKFPNMEKCEVGSEFYERVKKSILNINVFPSDPSIHEITPPPLHQDRRFAMDDAKLGIDELLANINQAKSSL